MKEVPPITTEAMTSISVPRPSSGMAVIIREEMKTAAMDAQTPANI